MPKQLTQPSKVPRINSNYVSYAPPTHVHYIQPNTHPMYSGMYDNRQKAAGCCSTGSPHDKKQQQQPQGKPNQVALNGPNNQLKKKPEAFFINKITNNYYQFKDQQN